MKTYEQYHNEYLANIFKQLQNAMVVKENIYISFKWQEDNKWNPCDADADVKLQELHDSDEQLFIAVTDGLRQINSIIEDDNFQKEFKK
jgi:hypothetical protein